jgi:hypothetical protein
LALARICVRWSHGLCTAQHANTRFPNALVQRQDGVF